MNLYDAMFVRRSVRRYKKEGLEQKTLDNILRFAESLEPLEEGHHIEFKIIENKKVSLKAPYYFIIACEEKENYLLNAGYLMCQIALYMTSKGIASCFQGMKKPESKILEELSYPFAIMMEFGRGEGDIYRDVKKIRRKKAEELSFFKAEVSSNVKTILKAAVLAPSSFNSQPWRFVVYENRIHIFARKGSNALNGSIQKIIQIDIGIMLAYLLLAAEELWMETAVKKLENIAEKPVKKNEYIISVLIK